MLSEARRAKIVPNPKGLDMAYYGVKGGTVAKGSLDLGGNEVVEFLEMPWTHWPETFPAFGGMSCSHVTGSGPMGRFAVGLFRTNTKTHELLRSMKKYYANVISACSPFVRRALERVGGLRFRMIAPSHGPVHVGKGGLWM